MQSESPVRIFTEPQVYIVGRQTVDDAELDRFLDDHGVTWESDSDVAAEVLTETAGRLCFDDRTEILTSSGWEPVANLSKGDILATLNPRTRELEYQESVEFHQYDFDGDLLAVDGRDISFAVTPEHRQFVSLGKKHSWGDYQFVKTSDLLGRRFRVLTAPQSWNGTVPESVTMEGVEWSQSVSNQFHKDLSVRCGVTDSKTVAGIDQISALAKLIAHYVANGSVADQKGTGKGIVIYGREFKEVQGLAESLGWKTSVCIDKRNGCPRTSISTGSTGMKWFKDQCGRGFAAKKFPRWVVNLPSAVLREIWLIMVKTDGYRYENGREIVLTGSTEVANQLQEILAKSGFGSRLTTDSRTKTGVPCHCVAKKRGEPAVRSGTSIVRKPYKGKVYCPTTENGVVLVRRDGKVHLSGNCYMSYAKPRPGGNSAYLDHIKESGHGSVLEASVWNLIITNVSRSLTHELIRHRAGMGFSQTSQRYVDESVAEYVEPDIIANDPELHEIWLNAVKHSHAAYVKLAAKLADKSKPVYEICHGCNGSGRGPGHASGLPCHWCRGACKILVSGHESPTDQRKAARQAARSVLPNATETKIFVTANGRSLRHFCEQRGSRHADPEIRKLANKVFDVLVVESPNLFGDYSKTPLPDGTFELTTPHRKV